ncbi:DUF4199 domain-containing protein [Cesiribacter andamanensis]|uniref:DUF4199 domain-containing protein n=1 Tax=Cesiribacter andamanensis AMV16 TaxID=1279009 RepID=M7P2K1_9BACT|nr:DUF4199 domain-containing protein [Cesiribacter andamanensis]EMR04759.1 hypothetical protein ADICEAN_00030 [Cesiribacter andamanensis AMV16]
MEATDKKRITIEQIGIRYGLILAGANIGFFLLMSLLGLEERSWLRFFNLVFIFFVVYKGLQYFKHHTRSYWTYFKGLGVGMVILLVGALIFSIFIGAYSWLNPGFIEAVQGNLPLNVTFGPLVLAMLVFLETMIYGFILTFACMQRLKTSHMQDSVHNY